MESYEYLANLDLADYSCATDLLEVDILIGSDHYWKLVTGEVIRSSDGPMAIQTKLGWVLSGPVQDLLCESTSCNLITTHTLRVDTYTLDDNEQRLDSKLKMFWDLESLGIKEGEPDVYGEFGKGISFKGGRYEVTLPWKESHPILPSHYDLSVKRLTGLFKRLRHTPEILQQYDTVIKDQLERGIVEVVDDTGSQNNLTHYLPHHPVVREDKSTTKLRIVYDASAKTCGPSLNECLYAGPKFGQSIMDILLRFRTYRTALAADIEKAFLMISVAPHDRDVLRFLWVDDISKKSPKIMTFRFTRVVFGVSSSPFLLNATIKHHMQKYREIHPEFVKIFARSIYVDDVTYGASDDDAAFELYVKSKKVLAEGGFNLRKFVSNSQNLQRRIEASEGHSSFKEKKGCGVVEEDKTYTKDVLGGVQFSQDGEQKILGVRWNFVQDQLVFDLSELATLVRNAEPTKRYIVGVGSKFYDPLGFISPITIQFKMLFQDLCLSKIDWDAPLSGELISKWRSLVSNFQSVVMTIPRCYSWSSVKASCRYSLFGFCDASSRAYAAVVYVRVETDVGNSVEFVASKTRVSPVEGQTIPRLELLSALLLAKLISSVITALEHDMKFSSIACFTDSKVALYWIRGLEKEWRPFVQNWVKEIRKLVPINCWCHCPGRENPADIPSRGMMPSELSRNLLWRHGPNWLVGFTMESNHVEVSTIPEACLKELKITQPNRTHTLLTPGESTDLSCIINCEDFSKLSRLLRVTAYVIRIVRVLKCKIKRTKMVVSPELSAAEIAEAESLWVKVAQKSLIKDKSFNMWKKQFGLFLDGDIWRCKGRLENAELAYSTRHPALLPKHHHMTVLIIRESHERVMHNGVKETLAETRSKYWIIHGRQSIRQVLLKCVNCRRYEGPPQPMPQPPPLPQFRLREEPAFTYVGLDFAGPLYVKTQDLVIEKKVWICLFTCCVVRAVHLDIVPNMTVGAFL